MATFPVEGAPVVADWLVQTQALVKDTLGELEAALCASGADLEQRYGRLSTLAQGMAVGPRLKPSGTWDRYVFVMGAVGDSLAHDKREGENIRAMFFQDGGLTVEDGRRWIDAWLRELRETLQLAPAIRSMWVSSEAMVSPVGYGYEGLSAEVSNVLGRLDHYLMGLESTVPVTLQYCAALGEPFRDYSST